MSYTFFYACTSTMEQNIKIQLQQALEHGFVFDEVIQDEGISGHQNFANRPGGDGDCWTK